MSRYDSGTWWLTPDHLIQQASEPLPLSREINGRGRWIVDDDGNFIPRREANGRFYWMFQDAVYATEEVLSEREVLALLTEKENRARARVARAVSALELNDSAKPPTARAPISDDVKIFVWQRDAGRCVRCGSVAELEFDHIIPVSMGGSNTARNLQLLCAGCNREKSGRLV